MENNKTPVNDDLTKECFETFWIEIRSPLLFSFEKGFLTEELSTSQKQVVIKLLGKKIEIRLIKNWRTISFLNIDVELISEALPKRIKKLLCSLTSPNQTA